MTEPQPKCELCGEPMPAGEEMFKFHGYSGPCPKPPQATWHVAGAIPLKPGYYWAKWKIPAEDTHEGDELCPSRNWEIVQVNANRVDWQSDPSDDEALSVSVCGVREVQWRDCFFWGDYVCSLERKASR